MQAGVEWGELIAIKNDMCLMNAQELTQDNMIVAKFTTLSSDGGLIETIYTMGYSADEAFLEWFIRERYGRHYYCQYENKRELFERYRIANLCKNSSVWNPVLTINYLKQYNSNIGTEKTTCEIITDPVERKELIDEGCGGCLLGGWWSRVDRYYPGYESYYEVLTHHLKRQITYLWREKLLGRYNSKAWDELYKVLKDLKIKYVNVYNVVVGESYIDEDGYWEEEQIDVDLAFVFRRFYESKNRIEMEGTYWIGVDSYKKTEFEIEEAFANNDLEVVRIDNCGNVYLWSEDTRTFSGSIGCGRTYGITELGYHTPISRAAAYKFYEGDEYERQLAAMDKACEAAKPFGDPEFFDADDE